MQKDNEQIITLIPQRPPIVMVSSLTGIENNISITTLTISADNLFVDNGELNECGIIEHMAQSAAARTGYIARQNHQNVKVGYIGSVNDFILNSNPKVGDTIITHISILQEVANISVIEARSFVNDREVASCRMKIFLEQ